MRARAGARPLRLLGIGLLLLAGAAPRASVGGDATLPDGWWERASAEIRRAEYRVGSDEEHGLHAVNRAQGLRANFDLAGVEILERDAGAPALRVHLELLRAGSSRSTRAVEQGRPAHGESSVRYTRGPVSERWDNAPEGLRVTVALTDLDPGERPRAVFRLATGLRAFVAGGGGEIRLYDSAGPVLRLRADGASPAVLHLDDDRLGVTATAPGAETVSFVVTSGAASLGAAPGPSETPDWLAEGNRAFGAFGASVATAGDVNGDGFSDLLVGSPNWDGGMFRQGRALLFLGSAKGPATSPSWTAQGNQVEALFGSSVATAGDVNGDGFDDVAIGADSFANGQDGEGLAVVYLGSASGLAATPAWSAEGNQVLARFGKSVRTAGDVNGDGFDDLLVGASFFDAGENEEGRVFLYAGSSGGLGAAPLWTADGDSVNAQLGTSVSTAGDVNGDGFDDVILGAPAYSNVEVQEGRALVYFGSPAGLSSAADWSVESDEAGARLGESVSLAGDVNGDGFGDVIVGVPLADHGVADAGDARVYYGSASGLSLTADRVVTGTQVQETFGQRVSAAGDADGDGFADVLIGAPGFDGSQNDGGAAFLYFGSPAGLSSAADWSGDGGQADSRFGAAVAVAGDVNGDGFGDFAVGAPQYEGGEIDEGRATLYFGGGLGLVQQPGWVADGDVDVLLFGTTLAGVGDVNGDGLSDVLVGAPLFANGQASEGAVFVYHGSTAGLAATPDWTAEGDQASALFGTAAGPAGDVNGDGFADVIVGAPDFDNGEIDEGRAFVYLGSPAGLGATPEWTAEGDQVRARFGAAVRTAGDVNGDGFADVIVGAPRYDGGENDEGRVAVYLGSASGLSASADWTAESDVAGAQFGGSAATAGDVNGDGFSDVVVGAALLNDGTTVGGGAFVYYGSRSGLSGDPLWRGNQAQPGAQYGVRVASAGDVNGDGYSDILVGAPALARPEPNEGGAFLYLGSPVAISAVPAWTAEGNRNGVALGSTLAAAGDVDGDGFGDVVVGAPDFDNGQTREGRALLYRGSADGLASSPDWIFETDVAEGRLGSALDSAGDLDGDGFGDIVVGAPLFSDDQFFEGRVLVFQGNGGGGLPRPSAQLQVGTAASIGLLGRSDSDTSFRLRHLARSPAGRSAVRLQWEVRPLGAALDAGAVEAQPGATDTGSPEAGGSAVELEASVNGLDAQRTFCDNGTACSTDADCAGIGSGACNTEPVSFYRWRVRAAADNPFFPTTPWVSIPGNAVTETKLRSDAALPPPRFRIAGPAANEAVFPDSTPLSFGWNRGPAREFVIEWSRNPDFAVAVESLTVQTPGAGDFRVFAPDAELWNRILRLGQTLDFRGAPVFWRIVPTDAGIDPSAVEFRVLRVASPDPPEHLTPLEGEAFAATQPPTLIWEANHNERFRVRFGASPAIGWPRVVSGMEFDIAEPRWTVPQEVWDEIAALSLLNPDGSVYYAVLARDSLDRATFSRVRRLQVLGATGQSPANTTPRRSGVEREPNPRPVRTFRPRR